MSSPLWKGGGGGSESSNPAYLHAHWMDCAKQNSSKPDLFPWQPLRWLKDESVGGRGGWAENGVGTVEDWFTERGGGAGGLEVNQSGLETPYRL